MTAASALSDHFDSRTAATEIAHALHDELDGACDLAVVFASFHHRAAFEAVGEILRGTLGPRIMLGTTAESVLGNSEEVEGRAGLSALALRLPDIDLRPFRLDARAIRETMEDPASLHDAIGVEKTSKAVLLLADPFTSRIRQMLGAIDACSKGVGTIPVIGGVASGGSRPGENVLLLNEGHDSGGVVGVTIGGPVDVDTLVSQGCRPIGDPMVVTRAKRNMILELGGKSPVETVRRLESSLAEPDRALIRRGLLVGVVINEYKEYFGRDDFLIRNVLGLEQKTKGILLDDVVEVGRTVQFHLRDAETASEDLQMLLDAEQLKPPPIAALLFTCNGRGSRLFGEPDHDAGMIRNRLDEPPLAGFFAAGEIGPIGGRSFVHGHTACLAMFRPGAL